MGNHKIDKNGIYSLDTIRLIEAHEMVVETITELKDVLIEIKAILIEKKDLLVEIKEALQGN